MIETFKQALLPLTASNTVQSELKAAAVLMPLVLNKDHQWEVILTKRADHLKHHPGQISFPGGGYEANDMSLQATAIRETHEEIGIAKNKIELLGQLPLLETVSNYQVTPFVGIIAPDYQLAVDQNEVAEVFTVPLSFVTDQTNQKRVSQSFNNRQYTFYTIEYENYNIWGATARILVNFSRRLNRG